MQGTKGICTEISTIIKELRDEGYRVIEKEYIEEELRKRYPIQNIDRETLEHALLDSYMGSALAYYHFYSVIQGERIFVDLDNTDDIGILDQLASNAQISKRAFENLIKRIEMRKENVMANQFVFDEDFELTGEFKRTETDEEMVEALKKFCKPRESQFSEEHREAQALKNKLEEKKGSES